MTDLAAQALDDAFRRIRELDLSIDEQFEVYTTLTRKERPEIAAAVDRLIERLRQHGVGDSAPRPGEPMPSFVLPDQNGEMVRLDDLLDAGPVAITFHRGHWCPYCRININALAQAQRELAEGQIIGIMPDLQKFVAELKSQSNVPFPILRDVDNGYALAQPDRLGWS